MREQIKAKQIEPKKMTLEEKNKAYLWHPFTQMKDYVADTPLIIERGEGVKLYDTKGNQYYDGVSSIWLNVHGHRKAELDQAIIDQLGKVAHSTILGMANVPSVELAEKLVEISPPGLNKVFYSDNGATAVEIALKMAYQYWQHKGVAAKTKFINFESAYHGDTIGAVSLGAIDMYHKVFKPLLFPTYSATQAYCYRCPVGKEKETCQLACLDILEQLLQQHAEEVCAVVIEPIVQGAAGIIVAPKGHLARVRELCNAYNVLLIADEVATGFGRTGTMFACSQEGVTPDLMPVGKGITGGYLPLAATMATDEIYNTFLGDYEELKTFFHGHSYTGNPLACAVALANLEVFHREKTLDSMQGKIDFIANELQKFWSLTHVGDIRQAGFMVGIELVKDRQTKEPYEWTERIGVKVSRRARELGMLTRPLGNVVVFMPPLSSTVDELREMLGIIYQAIRDLTE